MSFSFRPPRVCHATSQAAAFHGRRDELEFLDRVLDQAQAGSVVALVGAGGQGKTAIVQHWLAPFLDGSRAAEGVFLWSFYQGKDSDRFLQELYAYAEREPAAAAGVSASYMVDRLIPRLRRERWVLVLDGVEVVQYEEGGWFGRLVHPELGRLLEELAAAPLPGIVLLTSRFPFPELVHRQGYREVTLGGLDLESARGLLAGLGVHGDEAELNEAARACGGHPKAIELLGTFLAWRHAGAAPRWRACLPDCLPDGVEARVAAVLGLFQNQLPLEQRDLVALATAFREPPGEGRLLDYLQSPSVRSLLHETWRRTYVPFAEAGRPELGRRIDELVRLRLLERIRIPGAPEAVIDAHPLVRRAFEHSLGVEGKRENALARAGFLRGRPDRRKPASLDEARVEVELFHAHCEAGMWQEADRALVALDNPKHRLLAPALERDLLASFFPGGDWRRPPLWPGFGRHRSLAIALELLGQFEEAVNVYREADAPLRGDALIALGRLGPLLDQPRAAAPWESLWGAYRAHALSLAGRMDEARSLVRALLPQDVYEWVHVFECLMRIGGLKSFEPCGAWEASPGRQSQRYDELARRRMRADYVRLTAPETIGLEETLRELIEAYDQAGLPFERTLVRLSLVQLHLKRGEPEQADRVRAAGLETARRHGMPILEADFWESTGSAEGARAAEEIRTRVWYRGPRRP